MATATTMGTMEIQTLIRYRKELFTGGKVQIYNLPDSSNLLYNGNFYEANIGANGSFNLSPQTSPYVRVEATGDYINEPTPPPTSKLLLHRVVS